MPITRRQIARIFDVPEGTLRGHEGHGVLPVLGEVSLGEYIEALVAITDAQRDGVSFRQLRKGAVTMGGDDDVKGALILASRIREEINRCSSPGMTKGERLQVEVNAGIAVRAAYPDLERAWIRAHTQMGRGVAVHSGESGAFQAAKDVAFGKIPADSQRAGARAIAMLKSAGVLDAGDLRKIEQTEGLAKDRAADDFRTAPPTPAGVPWAALSVWYDGYAATEVHGMEAGAVLQSFRAGNMPSVYRVTFGVAPIEPGAVNWDGFANRYGDITAILGSRQRLEPKFPVPGRP